MRVLLPLILMQEDYYGGYQLLFQILKKLAAIIIEATCFKFISQALN